jgi:hypothetical protein
MIGVQTLHHLRQRDVGAFLDQDQQIGLVRIQPRPFRIASRPRRHAARAPLLVRPAAHRCLPDAQPPPYGP